MKKFVLSLVAAFAISPVMASEPVNLSSFGLGNLQPVSEAAGMQVRGMSSAAQGSSMAAMSALLIDPISGSKASLDAASFNYASDENAGVELPSFSNTAANIVFPALELNVDNGVNGNFIGTLNSGAIFSQGQGGADPAFVWNLPSFDFFFVGP